MGSQPECHGASLSSLALAELDNHGECHDMIVLAAYYFGKPGTGDDIEANLAKMAPW